MSKKITGNLNITSVTTENLNISGGITTGNLNITGSLYQNGEPFSGSQWASDTSGNISYTSGNVDIGNSSENYYLNLTSDLIIPDREVISVEYLPSNITWNETQLNSFLSDVIWIDELSLYVAVGSQETVATSTDGVTWNVVSLPTQTYDTLECIYWDPNLNLIFAGGSNAIIYTSSDAITWSKQASFNGSSIFAFASNNNIVVLINESYIYSSTDGFTWTLRHTSQSFSWFRDIIWVDYLNLFVTIGYIGNLATSSDGINWSETTISGSPYLEVLAWSDTLQLLVTCGTNFSNGVFYTSSDGINWTQRATTPNLSFMDIIWVDDYNMFLSVGYNQDFMAWPPVITKYLYASTNGITWNQVSIPDIGTFTGLTYNPNTNTITSISRTYIINSNEPIVTTYVPLGNVGIGTTSPNYSLDVLGDLNFTRNMYKNNLLLGNWISDTIGNISYTSGSVSIPTSAFINNTSISNLQVSNTTISNALLTSSTMGSFISELFTDTFPPVRDGLIAQYNAKSLSGLQLSDLSGNNNHVTNIFDINTTTGSGISYLYGSTNSYIIFPSSLLPANYTLFHVAKYNGFNRQRIFTSTNVNWLSGFWQNNAEVAFHNDWLNQNGVSDSLNWLISSDTRTTYRANGTVKGTNSNGVSAQITINGNFGYFYEPSDWAVAEIVIYDRELSTSEIEQVESWLMDKYSNFTFTSSLTYPSSYPTGTYPSTEMRNLMTVKSSGYIGFGTTSPNYKLDIVGDINFTGSFLQNGSTYDKWLSFNTSGIYYNEPITIVTNSTFGITTMTSNSVGSFVASASSNNANTYLAFDNNLSTSWDSGTGYYESDGSGNFNASFFNPQNNINYPGAYIKIELPSARQLTAFEIAPDSVLFATTAPKRFRIFGSNDNVFWYEYAAQYDGGAGIQWTNGDIKKWGFGGDQDFTANGTGGLWRTDSYKYYLLTVEKINGNSGKLVISHFNIITNFSYPSVKNVGIGTTSPNYTLDVIGEIRASGGALLINNSNTIGNIFTTGGNVGINTTTPTATLDINGTSRIISRVNPSSGQGLELSFNTNTSRGNIYSYNRSTNTYLEMNFNDMMIFGSTGNIGIGIGTGVAGAKLDVNGNLRVSGGTLLINNSNTIGSIITTGGNVGIGTTAPFAKLHIDSSDGNRVNGLYLKSAQAGLMLDSTYSTNGRAYNLVSTLAPDGPGTGAFGILDHTNSAWRFVINTAGNIGIGTNTPSQLLDVAGNIRFTGNLIQNGTVVTTSSAGTQWITNGTSVYYNGGNIGIGRSNPIAPLSFADTVGQKITLWGSDVSANYGLGIAGGELRIHNDSILSSVVFGYGSSTSFTETMKIQGNGLLRISTNSTSSGLSFTVNPSFTLANFDLQNENVANLYQVNGGDVNYTSFWGHSFQLDAGGLGDNSSASQGRIPGTSSFTVNKRINSGQYGNLFTIRHSGYIGIGTTAPVAKLHISGSDSLNSGVNAALQLSNTVSGSNNTWTFRATPTGGLSIGDNSDYRMAISSTGNLGIGTLNPTSKLHVNGGIRGDNIIVYNESTNPNTRYQTNNAGQFFDVGSEIAGQQRHFIWGGGGFPLVLGTNNTERMRVSSSGNIGISTNDPSELLHISNGNVTISTDTSSAKGFLFNQNSVWGGMEIEALPGAGAQTINLGVNTNRSKSWSSSYPGLWFRIDNRVGVGAGGSGGPCFNWFSRSATSGTDTELMRLSSAGNLGIGTNNPTTILHIARDSQFGNQLTISGSSNPNGQLMLGYNTSNNCGSIQAILQGTGFHNLALQPDGASVGIGTKTPGYKLDVQGGDINASGSVRSNGAALTSDQRVKENIIDADTSVNLEHIMALEVKHYDYTQAFLDHTKRQDESNYGFIAQQVETIIPNAVDIQSITLYRDEEIERPRLDENGNSILDENGNPIMDMVTERVVAEEIPDFHFLKKDLIYTEAVGAIQELYKRLQTEKEEHEQTKLKLDDLENNYSNLLSFLQSKYPGEI